jgi:hypothetical protein
VDVGCVVLTLKKELKYVIKKKKNPPKIYPPANVLSRPPPFWVDSIGFLYS